MATRIPIPTIQRRHRLTEGLSGARAPLTTVADSSGQALARIGNVLGGVAQFMQKQELDAAAKLRKEEDIAWLSKASSDDQLKWMQTFTERQNAAPAGAPDFTPQLLGEFDQYVNQAVTNAPERIRPAYRESLTRLRTHLGGDALKFEATSRRNHLVSQYAEAAQADAASIALNPALYDERRVFLTAAIGASDLPEDVKTKMLDGAESALAMSAGSTLATSQPRQVIAAMRAAADGKPVADGYGWVNRLDANQVLQLRTKAQAEIDRRENKAIIAAAARERQAAGALDAFTKQMTLGIAPRQEDLAKWTTLVKGSVHEATFNRLQQGWGDVQSLFSKPVAEQIAGLQDMQKRLKTEGGNVQDVGLLELAQRGIAANIQMQVNDPLQWSAQFADTDPGTLDLSTLGTPEGNASIQETLAQRENTIAASQQQNPGVDIAQTLLLPQEATQIVRTFAAGNANERTQLLGSLAQVAGLDNPKRLENMLAQLEQTGMPGADVMVRYADIAAREARITIDRNTFSADTVQSNRDVVATGLHGLEILQANGKTKEGMHYKLPKDDEIMAHILDEIGVAYGSPVPGDSGYVGMLKDAELIKHWYVGEAARSGKLTEDLNKNLLDQAIKATSGEKVDFHGNGEVFAPLGMDENRFIRHASLAIEGALKAQNLWTKASDASDFGLRAIGGDRYMVTLGDAPVGVSITIDPNDTEPDTHSRNQRLEAITKQSERVRQRLPRSRERYLQSQGEPQ